MEIREWRAMAFRCIGLLGIVLLCSVFFSFLKGKESENVQAQRPEQKETASDAYRMEARFSKQTYIENSSDTYIRIDKKELSAKNVYLEDDYMHQTVSLILEGAGKDAVETPVYRMKSDWHSRLDSVVRKVIRKVSKQEESDRYILDFKLQTICEPVLYETEQSYYITLADPREKYDKIVVIDAGHGGFDQGTYSPDTKYTESEYALKVVIRLKELLEQSDIKTYYTRLSDQDVSKADRVRLANTLKADAFVSVHCNASDPGETSAHGIEALYSGRRQTANRNLTSRELASHLLQQVCRTTGRKKRGTIRRDGLYLMHHAKVPVSIIEIGYMTNPSELKYILKDENQQKIAQGIYQGILDALE